MRFCAKLHIHRDTGGANWLVEIVNLKTLGSKENDNVWIRANWNHRNYLCDCLDRKESVRPEIQQVWCRSTILEGLASQQTTWPMASQKAQR
jgi:hypothetical protein